MVWYPSTYSDLTGNDTRTPGNTLGCVAGSWSFRLSTPGVSPLERTDRGLGFRRVSLYRLAAFLDHFSDAEE
jgi:hypothetical protein